MATVHLINPLVNSVGGAQWRTLTLFELLAERTEVQLWTESTPDPSLAGRYPIRQITSTHIPKKGNLVFIGAYFRIGNWVQYSDAKRIVIVFNSHLISDLHACLEGFARIGRNDVELAFASEGIRKMADLPGPIHVSPINTDRFRPNPVRGEAFAVGRMGRDDWSKHHPEDPVFFQSLLDRGFRVRLMGCQAKSWNLTKHPNLELLSPNQENPEAFLNTLHAFHFRGHPDWYETFGRVNLEAMCCGVPVVAEARHGYVDYLQNQKGGFLYEDSDEAHAHLNRLRESQELWEQQSRLAVEAAHYALAADKIDEVLNFYSR